MGRLSEELPPRRLVSVSFPLESLFISTPLAFAAHVQADPVMCLGMTLGWASPVTVCRFPEADTAVPGSSCFRDALVRALGRSMGATISLKVELLSSPAIIARLRREGEVTSNAGVL